MISLRNNSLVPPFADFISARAVGHANGMSFPMSLRGLLAKRDKTRVRRYGVWICTPTDRLRTVVQPDYWYDRLFAYRWGIATFFREMSGGRQYVEWEVIDRPLLSTPEKAQADAGGPPATVAAYRAAAAKLPGVALSDYDFYVWVIDDGTANRGTTPSDTLLTALDGDLQLFCHEMTHAFGVCPHADRTTYDDYNDPFCVMSQGSVARSFENQRLEVPNYPPPAYTLGTTGPGICAPYLLLTGWLSYADHVEEIPGRALPLNTRTTLFANHGAPPDLGRHIALALGDRPSRVGDPPQFWIEYRHTSRFDQQINAPVDTHVPDLPTEGVVVLRKVEYLDHSASGRCTGLHSYVLNWVGARRDALCPIPALKVAVRVVNVDMNDPSVVLAIEPS
jgi:hypothetical protein